MSTAAATATENRASRSFVWSRIGSFVSLFPLGIWTVNHLWDNLAAFSGATAWENAVTHHPHPIAHALTLVMVLLPLVLHSVWGVQRAFSMRPNNLRYGFYENLKYVVQRIAGVGALFFIGAHLYLAMLKPRLIEGHAEPFSEIAREMRFHGPTLFVYIVGSLGVTYHLANGLSTFLWSWGITATDPKQRRFDVVFWITFLLLTAMAWGAIFALYTAGEQFGPGETH